MRHIVAVLTLGATVLAPVPLAAGETRPGSSTVPKEAAALASQRTPGPPSRIETAPARSSINAPLPIGGDADVYCSGWLGEFEETFAGQIIGADRSDSQRSYFEGDLLYLDIGTAQGIGPGQEFWICRPGRLVYESLYRVSEAVGRIYATPGRLRIICAQESSSIGEIVLSCGDVEVGDRVQPFEPIPIPLVRRTRPLTSCDPPSTKTRGHIVESRDNATALAADSIVFLDLGEKDGLAPGDFLTVYRSVTEPNDLKKFLGKFTLEPQDVGVPDTIASSIRTVLGEVAILATRSRTAVARVITLRDTMYIGDLVEVK